VQLRFDVDAYLASGGQLLDLDTPDETAAADIKATNWSNEERERMRRLGMFFRHLGAMCPANTKVGDVFTEEQARAMWRDTSSWMQ
jgi:hypothetical protein